MIRQFANYIWKPYEEAFRAGIIAAGAVAVQTLVTLDPAKIADWRAWGIGVGTALLVAFVAGVRGAAKIMPVDTEKPAA